jgi:hypothetical protein
MTEQIQNSIIITFGKHNGRSLEDISKDDMNWVIWFSKNYDPYYSHGYRRPSAATISRKVQMLNEAREIVSRYFEKIADDRRENSNSDYIEPLKSRDDFKLEINRIKSNQDYGYTIITGSTSDGNLIRFYDKGFELEIGDIINITGTPTKHIEILGEKQTYINRVKLDKND